ncbi:hypothetical protein ACIPW5_25175 [Streptomyces sp. NPDC090077]|uniref:hypothetical protein n=1 Tax=Streptomyces sp. NPDC090077 TaxID=3365938 RepID=UPI003823A23F
MRKRHTRLALLAALLAPAAALGAAAPAGAAPGALPAASCTASPDPAKPGSLLLAVSGFSGDLKVTETGGAYKMVIHKGTETIPVPQGNYTVEWANAPTPDRSERTACTPVEEARTQAQDQYALGYRQGLADALRSCTKVNAPGDNKDPGYRQGYDAGVALALASQRCKTP